MCIEQDYKSNIAIIVLMCIGQRSMTLTFEQFLDQDIHRHNLNIHRNS